MSVGVIEGREPGLAGRLDLGGVLGGTGLDGDGGLSGSWLVTEGFTGLSEVYERSGGRDGWSLRVMGDGVRGVVNADDSITGEIDSGSDAWPVEPASHDARAPGGPETITIDVNRDFEATFVMTAQ
jgi:hypothetical protein